MTRSHTLFLASMVVLTAGPVLGVAYGVRALHLEAHLEFRLIVIGAVVTLLASGTIGALWIRRLSQ